MKKPHVPTNKISFYLSKQEVFLIACTCVVYIVIIIIVKIKCKLVYQWVVVDCKNIPWLLCR